jgi:hypothetical protein
MPEKAIAAASRLSDELHARGRRERVRNAVETAILIVVACLVGAILFNVVASRAENTRRSRERKAQIDKVLEVQAQIRDATNPDGCVAKRGQASQAAAILQIVNDNRVIHGKPIIPVPTTVTPAPCPGEPGGPPLVVNASSSPARVHAEHHTNATTQTALPVAPGSGSGP